MQELIKYLSDMTKVWCTIPTMNNELIGNKNEKTV